MKKNDISYLFTRHRQSPIAISIILIKFFRNLVRAIWPILLVWIIGRDSSSDNNYFTAAIIGLSSVTVISSIIAYFKYYYHINESELIIEKGLLNKKKILIPFDRIQSIDFEQNLIHQFFDVVSVKIDTAGSGQNEVAIEAVDKKIAEDLKDYLLSQRESTTIQSDAQENVQLKEPSQDLVHLDFGDLLRIGVSQNHLQTAGLIIAFFFGFLDDIEQALNIDFVARAEDYLGIFHLSNFTMVLIFIPVLLVIAFVITLFRTILKYYDFKLQSNSKGFTSTTGLLTRNEKFINLQKIQMVTWSQNPLERLFRLFEISLKQASSIEVKSKQSMHIPGAYEEQLDRIKMLTIDDNLFLNQDDFGIDRSIVWRMVIYAGLLPMAPIALTFSNFGWIASIIISIIYLLLVIWMAWRYQQRWRIQISKTGVLAVRGIYGIKYTAIPFLKIQAIRIKQNLFQHRKGLASLLLSTASGSLVLPYIPLELAKKLNDYILFYVEGEDAPWM